MKVSETDGLHGRQLLIAFALLIAASGACQAETADTTAPSSDAVTKVAFAYVSPAADASWSQAHDLGRQAVEDAYPGVETLFVESLPENAEATRAFNQFVADGAEMIFATSEYADFLYEVADANPAVKVLELHGHRTTPNQVSYYIKAWLPSYLYGVAAGLMTESNKLGYIGSFPVPDVFSGVNAFQLGAQRVNPNVTTQAILVNNWFDPSADAQAANSLVDSGVDFIYGITIPTAYLQVAEERGVWAAGWWSLDQREFGPNAYVGSIVHDWGPFYTSEVGSLLDGSWRGDRHQWVAFGEGFDISEWGDKVPDEVKSQVEEVRAEIVAGTFDPFEGPVTSSSGDILVEAGQTLDDYADLYLWDKGTVEGVIGLSD